MSKCLSALVVGCGRIGGGIVGDVRLDEPSHAAAYARHQGFRIAACIEPDPLHRTAFMAKWNVANGFANLDEAMAGGIHFDVASICTPTPQHAADLRTLASSNVRAVWCEKPLTAAAAESAEIVEAYQRVGKSLAVNYLRRWQPSMVDLKSRIADGEWGQVRAGAGFYTKGIRNNGGHLIDLVQWLLGPLEPKQAIISRIDHDPSDPNVDAILQLSNGAPIHLVAGDARDYAIFELEIIAARGALRIERSGRSIRTRRTTDDPDAEGYRILENGQFAMVATNDAFLNAADNIYHAIIDGAPLASDGATALAAERVCDALIERATCS